MSDHIVHADKMLECSKPKLFKLIRNNDISGISGTGLVAYGCEFQYNFIVLFWIGSINSMTFHTSMSNIEHIHCHSGLSFIQYIY